jgi:hypothetical protein
MSAGICRAATRELEAATFAKVSDEYFDQVYFYYAPTNGQRMVGYHQLRWSFSRKSTGELLAKLEEYRFREAEVAASQKVFPRENPLNAIEAISSRYCGYLLDFVTSIE